MMVVVVGYLLFIYLFKTLFKHVDPVNLSGDDLMGDDLMVPWWYW